MSSSNMFQYMWTILRFLGIGIMFSLKMVHMYRNMLENLIYCLR